VSFGPVHAAHTPHIVASQSALRTTFGLRLLFDPSFIRAALWVILSIAVVVRLAQFVVFSTQEQWGYDFSAYFWAGADVLAGRSPYDAFQLDGMYSPQSPQGLYLYPPAFAVFIAPLAAISGDYRVVNWLWAGLGAVLLVAVVIDVGRRELVFGRRDVALLLLAGFAFAPVIGELVMGNVHLLILGLLAGAWLALRDRSARGELVAGALVGGATLIKIFPGVLILWFLLTGRRHAAVSALATIGILGLITLPFTGLEPWLQYPSVILNLGVPEDTGDVLAPSVWLSAVMPSLLSRIVVAAAGLAVLAWAVDRRSEPVSYAVAVAVSILIAPALYQHYLALLVLPMLLAIRFAPPLAWVAVAFVLLSGGEQEALGDWVWIVNRALPTLGAILVVAGLVFFGERRWRESVLQPA
jgi:alpha-1,2-mannosyltransferase